MDFWFWKKSNPTPKEPIPEKAVPYTPPPPPPQPAPELSPANPGTDFQFNIATSHGNQSGVEKINLVHLLTRMLKKAGHSVLAHPTWLELDSKLVLQPRLVFAQAAEDSVQSCSTIDVTGPGVPLGIFEYQHSTGNSAEESFCAGFESWERCDLPVLLDAQRATPKNCMGMQMVIPATAHAPERIRRAIFGPVMHFQQQKPTQDEEHPFCNCCLLTQSMAAFKGMFESDEFHALRLFVARDNDGAISADCRVNGEDYEIGKQALCAYAERWPAAGYEFRKQYVILQDNPA